MLNIVDLAGSERTAKNATKVKTKDAKGKVTLVDEGIEINKSLTTLGRVFGLLANRKASQKSVPPYRESKLTRLLAPSLTYDSKTVMIVNVCSARTHARQSKESLDFAKTAMIAL